MVREVVDRATLLDRVGGSRELLDEVTGMYTDVRPALLHQIETAIEAGDIPTVRRQVHRLKGTFGSLAAVTACAITSRIAELARKKDLTGIRKEYVALVDEARKVEDELRRIDAQEWGEPTGAR